MAQSIFIALLSLEGRYMDSRQNAIIAQSFTFKWPSQHFSLEIYVHGEDQGLLRELDKVDWRESHTPVFFLPLSESLL